MKQTGKKALSLILTLCMVVSLFAGLTVTASADSGTGTLYYDFVEITNASGLANDTTYLFTDTHYTSSNAVSTISGDIAKLTMTSTGNNSNTYMQADIKADPSEYVSVAQAGSGFDSCAAGGIVYTTISTKFSNQDGSEGTGWYYWCQAGGARGCGPYYAYTFKTGAYGPEDITVTVKPTIGLNDTVTKDDLTVKVKAGDLDYTATDYTFTDESVTSSDRSFTINVGGVTKTLTAGCVITYTTNSGSSGSTQQVVKYPGVPIYVPSGDGTWAGHIFKGWTLTSGSKVVNYAPSAEFNVDADTTLYAVWDEITYHNVTFDGSNSQQIESGKMVTKPADPTKDEAYFDASTGNTAEYTAATKKVVYAFAGWKNQATGQLWDFSAPVTDDLTLVSSWTETVYYKVSFDKNGVGTYSTPSQWVEKDDQVIAVDAPTSVTNGSVTYYFAGWNTQSNGSGDYWNFTGSTVKSNLTLYAQWTTVQSYNVVFDDNVGDPEDDYISVTGSLTQAGAETAVVTVPTISRVDYTFGGWYTDAACTAQYMTTQSLGYNNAAALDGNADKSITLYAKWTANYSDDDKVLVASTELSNGVYRGYYTDYIEAFKNDSAYPDIKVEVYRNFFLVNANGNKANPSKLPEGLFLNKRTGEVYGVPTETGEFSFYVRLANDEGQWISKTYMVALTVDKAVFSVDMADDNTGLSKVYGENDPDFYPATGALEVTFTKGAPDSISYSAVEYETTFNYDYSSNNTARAESANSFNPTSAVTLKYAPDLDESHTVAANPTVTVNMDFHREDGEDVGVYKLGMGEECVWVMSDVDEVAPAGYDFTIAEALAATELTYNENGDLTTAPEYVFTIGKLDGVSYTVTVPYGTYAPGGDAAGATWSNTVSLADNAPIGVKDILNTAIITGTDLSTSGKLEPGTYTATATVRNSADSMGTADTDTTGNYNAPTFTVTITAKTLTPEDKAMYVVKGGAMTLEKLQGLVDLGGLVPGDKVGVTITSVKIGETTYSGEALTGADFADALAGLTAETGSKPITIGYSAALTGADKDNYSIVAGSVDATLTVYAAGGGGSTAPTTDNVPVIVDGVEYNIGTAKTESGVTTVTVDQTELQKQLDAASDTVVVPVTPDENADTVTAQLVIANVDEMAEKEMTLSVQVGEVSYDMRAVAIDTEAVMKELGATDPTKAPVNVTIKELSNVDVTLENGELVLPPVSFTVTASNGENTVEVEVFEKYVQRVIEIPSGVDASRITTGVVIENGNQRHVPTEVFQKDGKWYARINSLTNSTYALIFNEASFTDDDGKWFEAVATEMASRDIIDGRGDGVFDGEANITRAEFAAILVRALGLPENGNASAFTDVADAAWYYGAVGKAYEYGLVDGRGEGIFDPLANITRQEAMAMVHRAAAITELAGATGTLAAFSDADSISLWALADAQWNVGSGLIQGSNGMINGQDNITRAESATIILRLLQKSELVDVRTKA